MPGVWVVKYLGIFLPKLKDLSKLKVKVQIRSNVVVTIIMIHDNNNINDYAFWAVNTRIWGSALICHW